MRPVRLWASGRFGTAGAGGSPSVVGCGWTAGWVLDLWTLAPTPAKAARLRKATLARLLQEHRIRRVDAEKVLGLLRQPAITVAEGVTEAAVLHLHSLVARLRLANREFHQAERKLDELCTALKEDTT